MLLDALCPMVCPNVGFRYGDTTVYQTVMRAVATQFGGLGAAVRTQFELDVNHAWVVDNRTCTNIEHQMASDACCGAKGGSTHCPLPPHAAPIPVSEPTRQLN